MPSSTTLGFYDTNHTFASGSDGFTVIAVISPSASHYYTSIVTAAKSGESEPSIFKDAGLAIGSSATHIANLAGNYHFSTYTYVANQGPKILTALDGDGDQKLFEGTQVAFAGTTARSTVNIDSRLGGDWFLGNGYQHFGHATYGGGVFYEVLIFRGLLGYTVDGNGDLNGGEMNTVVSYLANKYGSDPDQVYER
jgi:hypothetical protein